MEDIKNLGIIFTNIPTDKTEHIIKVIGIGGGGGNAVKSMCEKGVKNVSFAVCNTDSQSLSRSPVPVKMLLGATGLGAGANPELGRQEAENNVEDIKKLLSENTCLKGTRRRNSFRTIDNSFQQKDILACGTEAT